MQGRRLKITAGGIRVTATLGTNATANMVWDALPIEADGQTWGDEIYFQTQVEGEEDDGQDVVDIGDLGYWPPGKAFCLFFGPTPASRGDEIRPASAVNVFGRIEGDATVLKQFGSGERVLVERA